jgi:uncharacterized protein YraI
MKRMSWLALALLLSVTSLSAQAQDGYVTVNLNMRAAPDSDYPLITTIRAGSAISVLGCIDDYQWCDVTAYGERGWVSGDYIEYEYQNRRVPLYGYGVQIGIPIVSFVIGDYWGSHYNHRSFYRDRDRWYRHPISYRSSSHHRRDRRDDRHDSRRDDRHDNRRDGRHDARQDNRNDRRSDGRSDDRQNTRRTVRDTANTGVNVSPRSAGRNQRSGASRQRAAAPRRAEARSATPSPRSDANRNQRQGRSNPPAQGQQRDRRNSNDGNKQQREKREKREKRDDKDKKDNKGDKDRRHH